MGDFSLINAQPECRTAFGHVPTLLPDGFCLCLGAFDDKHKITGIPAVRHRGVSLPVFSDRSTLAPLDTVIPVPAILSGFPAQIAFMQILIDLIEHDIRQQRRYYASLRHALTGCPKETDIDMSCLDGFHSRAMKRASQILRRTAYINSRWCTVLK